MTKVGPVTADKWQEIKGIKAAIKAALPNSREAILGSEEPNVLFVIGGDGTMLAAAYSLVTDGYATTCPIVGINVGKLGFLADVWPQDIEQMIEDVIADRVIHDERQTLLTRVVGPDGASSDIISMNDIVIEPKLSRSTLTYEVFVNGVSCGDARANGVVVSSPTGSTAYNLSLGGPIVSPGCSVMTVNPVAPMMLNTRPIITSMRDDLQIRFDAVDSLGYEIVSDGRLALSISEGENIVMVRGGPSVTFLRKPDWNFYQTLRQKLGWSLPGVKK